MNLRTSLDPHVRQVSVDFGFKLLQLGVEIADGVGVAFAELLDARDECERERIDHTSYAPADGGVPLVVEHERLDIGFSEVAVLLERGEVECGMGVPKR